MAISKELSLTDEERDAILDAEWNMRISTISPSGRINATPLWFVWHGGKVWAYCRGQKIANLRRNPTCTIVVDTPSAAHAAASAAASCDLPLPSSPSTATIGLGDAAGDVTPADGCASRA